jgi:NADPH:quinone reductase-like Zn-dependent oxidoreductase
MAQMRAVVAERPDGPDGLVVREVPRPETRPGWALVRVEAFGLNRSEYKTLKGYAGDAVTFPRILGIELVGVVEAVHGTRRPCRRGRPSRRRWAAHSTAATPSTRSSPSTS